MRKLMAPIGLGIGIGFGGAPAFDPSKISGLTSWFDAASGVTQSGSNVSAIADQSGFGAIPTLSQATGANQPTYNAAGINGKPDLGYAGGQILWSNQARILGLSGVTLFLVFSATGAVGVRNIWGAEFVSFHYNLRMNATKLEYTVGANLNPATAVSNNALNDGAAHAVIGVYDGAAVTMYVDGTTAQTVAPAQSGNIRAIGTDANAVGGVSNQSGTFGQFITGHTAIWGSYNKGLSAGEIASLMAYLRLRSGS